MVSVPGTAIVFRLISLWRKTLRGHNHRAVTIAHAASAGHQRVVVLNIRIGVERDGGDIVEAFAFPRFLIQSFDIAKGVREAQAGTRTLFVARA